MLFDKRLGLKESEVKGYTINQRVAVRGILFHDGKILTVKSNKGDYKLPGGGVDAGESETAALIREISEETGYLQCNVEKYIGKVVESHLDIYDSEAVFEMVSHYYICEWSGQRGEQHLDPYEEAQAFTPVWITLDEAISQNEKILAQSAENRWIYRENLVLNQLRNTTFFRL
ncbi:ADP-ribose pyrophosphatase YjhB, NUDIX family [Halobacillus dabanensis]|uniref:ADP-ribose pyrophosphatase YjhB, NUDIX family n=1 Tax=Halobacillus dabanensis TaxID=240302 RepID=A0A1I3WWF4_HALDA|nr:NUDIX domain-containing protein [Halobacillus dabanensis]SFK10826.1 ADP-ribose pyrophosphatase YjhB, NUDIX family [Halobacillus dabanensis]